MADGLHPYFSSGLRWQLRLADALAEARTHQRKVFIAHGNRYCSGTRALIERTLAKEEVAEMFEKSFVAVASDPDAPEPDVAALLQSVPKREPTPVILYLDGNGNLLSSTAGGRPPAVLLNDMLGAISRR